MWGRFPIFLSGIFLSDRRLAGKENAGKENKRLYEKEFLKLSTGFWVGSC
jgi:hypothetical protein